ncbi:hypothetical protein [Pseudomonas aeruginosa]|uniref:hypothetical protein n=1 Tax=Pseudomonas aeruginosa TaxID=287 RepID=UPI003305C2C3
MVAPKSFFATYKMTVATENGFLTSASFDGTANEVASKLASVVGDVVMRAKNKTSESAAQKAIEEQPRPRQQRMRRLSTPSWRLRKRQ